MLNDQWAMVNDQCSMLNEQWAMVNGKWGIKAVLYALGPCVGDRG